MKPKKYAMFCKRTEDPKLAYIERLLDQAQIPHRRNGSSWHAPILEVPEDRLAQADAILQQRVDVSRGGRPYTRVLDDIPDDHDLFRDND